MVWYSHLFKNFPEFVVVHIVKGLILHGKEMRKPRISDRLYFLELQITADGDCSHEIKRCLLLGRKAMTKLDSILKSRDITLPKKVHLVKAMVFLVVMYGCESWTIKKAECQRMVRLNYVVGEDS